MTRYARSGSTQRHQKQPEDATPWKKFSRSMKKSKRKNVQVTNGEGDCDQQLSDGDTVDTSAIDVFPTKKNTPKRGDDTVGVISKKKKKGKSSVDRFENSPRAVELSELSPNVGDEDEDLPGSDGEFGNDAPHVTAPTDFAGEKPQAMTKGRNRFMEKVLKNRAKSGIQLLPQPVEDNLYKIKKRLRDQGMPDQMVRDVARKERRKAELQLRSNKTCFNCRKFGHVVANCPQFRVDPEQGTGICFKCGSTEHISRNCHNKSGNFPFATCYICHEQGHLSRSCPKNAHGVYPKGGKCNFCGEIDHLKKDCPKLHKRKAVEEEITVGTLTSLKSMDEEMIERTVESLPKKKKKIVKF